MHRKRTFSEEERRQHKEIRERFQRERPSLESLVASGEYTTPIPQGTYLAILTLLSELRRVRENAGLSLSEMADRTGMDKATLSRLETGQHDNPTLATICRYADGLGKRLLWSFEDKSSEEQMPNLSAS